MSTKTASSWLTAIFGLLVVCAGGYTASRVDPRLGIAAILSGACIIAEAVYLRTGSRWAKRAEWGLIAVLIAVVFWGADNIYLFLGGATVLVIILPALGLVIPALPVYAKAKSHAFSFRDVLGSGLRGRAGVNAIDAIIRLRTAGAELPLSDANLFTRSGGNLERLAEAVEARVAIGLPPDLLSLQAATLAGHDPRSLSQHSDVGSSLVQLEKQRIGFDESSPPKSS